MAEAVEEREDPVWRLVAAWWRSGRDDPVDRFLFELVVGVHIDLRRGGALMPEPQRDREQIDLLSAQQHRVRMTLMENSP
ncbi:MAG TPA: hypothetical protein VIK04_20855 [Solirubrobacteraceae bacterium]